MFGLLNPFKLNWIPIVIVVAMTTVLGLGYHHYTEVLEDRTELQVALEMKEQALERETASHMQTVNLTNTWARAYEEQQRVLDRWTALTGTTTAETRRLHDVLTKHDLAALATQEPGLVQTHVNVGAGDVLRMLREASDASHAHRLASSADSSRPPVP